MSQAQPISDERLNEYLLGQLSEEETARLDEAAIVDDDVAARITALEHELFDAYAAGELSPIVRARFEEIFLKSAQGGQRLAVARALTTRHAAADARGRGRVAVPVQWRWLAAAAVVVLAVAVWRVLQTPDAPATPVQQDRTVDQKPPAPPPVAPSPGAVVALVLSPVASRSAADAATLVIRPEARTVALTLAGDPGARQLSAPRVTIRTVEGREVFRGPARPGRVQDNSLAEVDVPAALLTVDDYIVQLNDVRQGVEEERLRYFLRIRER